MIARYRETIPELMAQARVPGLALAVVDTDRVVWQQGFGSTERDGGTPVVASMAYLALGSTSKRPAVDLYTSRTGRRVPLC